MSSAPNNQTRQEDLDELSALVSDRQKMKMTRRQRPQRKQRKRHPERIPRPINCFMAYRLDMQKVIVDRCPGANHRDISKIVAKWWRQEPESVKEKYKIVAEMAKQEHLQMYPNYKYTPRRRRANGSPSSSSSSAETSYQQHQQEDNETPCIDLTSPVSMNFAASEPYDNMMPFSYGNGPWETAIMTDCWPTAPIMQDCTTMASVLHAPYYLNMDLQQQLTPTSFPESSDLSTAAALSQCWIQPTPSTSTSTASSSCSILSHHHQQQYEQHRNPTTIMDDNNIMPSSLLVTEPNSLSYNDVFLEDSSLVM